MATTLRVQSCTPGIGGPALSFARMLMAGDAISDDEDVVAEAFVQVLRQFDSGGGPTTSFRAYLHRTVRNEAHRVSNEHRRQRVSDDPAVFDRSVGFGHGRADVGEVDLVLAAMATLPEHWQRVLWRTEVEGLPPREVAAEFGIEPNAVAAMAYRARRALRVAYLEQHVRHDASSPECRGTLEKLAGAVGETLTPRAVATVRQHTARCASCSAAYDELVEVSAGPIAV